MSRAGTDNSHVKDKGLVLFPLPVLWKPSNVCEDPESCSVCHWINVAFLEQCWQGPSWAKTLLKQFRLRPHITEFPNAVQTSRPDITQLRRRARRASNPSVFDELLDTGSFVPSTVLLRQEADVR